MSQLRAVLRDQRGFTLTELLVVATVLGMILAGVVLIQMQGQQAYLFGSHRVEVQQNNRAALAEGIAFAERLGLDGHAFLEAARASAASSTTCWRRWKTPAAPAST